MGIPGRLEGRCSPASVPFSPHLNQRKNARRTVEEIPPTRSSTISAGNCLPGQQRQPPLRTQERLPHSGRAFPHRAGPAPGSRLPFPKPARFSAARRFQFTRDPRPCARVCDFCSREEGERAGGGGEAARPPSPPETPREPPAVCPRPRLVPRDRLPPRSCYALRGEPLRTAAGRETSPHHTRHPLTAGLGAAPSLETQRHICTQLSITGLSGKGNHSPKKGAFQSCLTSAQDFFSPFFSPLPPSPPGPVQPLLNGYSPLKSACCLQAFKENECHTWRRLSPGLHLPFPLKSDGLRRGKGEKNLAPGASNDVEPL